MPSDSQSTLTEAELTMQNSKVKPQSHILQPQKYMLIHYVHTLTFMLWGVTIPLEVRGYVFLSLFLLYYCKMDLKVWWCKRTINIFSNYEFKIWVMLYHKKLTKLMTKSLQGVCMENFSERLYCFQSYLFEQELLGKINMKLEPKAKIQ